MELRPFRFLTERMPRSTRTSIDRRTVRLEIPRSPAIVAADGQAEPSLPPRERMLTSTAILLAPRPERAIVLEHANQPEPVRRAGALMQVSLLR